MLAKELAKELLRCPDAEVMLSIDISTDESNYTDRAFSEEIEGIQFNKWTDPNNELSVTHCSIIGIGYFNNRNKPVKGKKS